MYKIYINKIPKTYDENQRHINEEIFYINGKEDSILSQKLTQIDHRPKYKTQNNKTSTRPHRRNPK